MSLEIAQLRQSWPRPAQPRPIVIIGAGDIVRDAHLPAYRQAGLPVAGVFDLRREVAEARAKEFNLPRVFATLAEAVAVPGAVFDVATPPRAHETVLAQLPVGAAVLLAGILWLTLRTDWLPGVVLTAAGLLTALLARR